MQRLGSSSPTRRPMRKGASPVLHKIVRLQRGRLAKACSVHFCGKGPSKRCLQIPKNRFDASIYVSAFLTPIFSIPECDTY